MKRFIACLCAVLALASAAVTASAEGVQQNTVITTTVPSSYVLTIPATVDIAYGENNANIGSVKVTGHISNDQYVKVTAASETNFCLVNDSDSSKKISYRPEDVFASVDGNGNVPLFRGKDFSASDVNGDGGHCLVVARISDYAWENAVAGSYSDTITFTASLESVSAAG